MKTDFLSLALCIAVICWCGDAFASDAPVPCPSGEAKPLLDQALEVGTTARRFALPAAKDADLLVQVVEEGVDVEATLLDSGREVATADSPVSRQGVQRLIVGRQARVAMVDVRSVDQAKHRGTVRVVVSSLGNGCNPLAPEFARADALFAAAQRAARGEGGSDAPPDAEARAAAAESAYREIARSGRARGLDAVRGEAELALAAIDYYNLGKWEESASWAGAAADSLAKAGKDYLRARARSIQAAAWLEKPTSAGTFAQARNVFEELAVFHRSRGETYDAALQINLSGVAYFNEARFEAAIAKYAEAHATFAKLGETQRAALAMQNIALCEWGLGHMHRALAQFEIALRDMDPEQRPALYMLTLNNAALASQAAGDFDKSLHLLDDAMRRATRLGDKYWRARNLFGLGVTYYGIGDRDLARQFLVASLAEPSELDERGKISALRTIANLESESGNLAQADRHNTEALTLARSTTARARISLKLAETALARGELAAVERIVGPLADERPRTERQTQAEARVVRARLRAKQGSLPAAEDDLRRAIPVFRELEALSEEFQARVELARLLRQSGRRDAAMLEIITALDCSEELRAQTVNPEYRASVAAAVRPALDLRLQLLWDAHDDHVRNGDRNAARRIATEALGVADASRARAFEQYRAQTFVDADPQLLEQLGKRANLLQEIADLRYYLETREDRGGPDDPRALALRDEIRRLRVSLGVVETSIAGSTRTSKVAAPRSIDAVLQRFGSDEASAVAEYWIGDASSYAWVVRGSRVSWIRIADGPTVTRAARRFHAALSGFATVPRFERLKAAEELHELVVAPLLGALEGARHWTIVPDGPLHFVPFAALKEPGSGGRYLAERVYPAMTPALRYAPAGGRERSGLPTGRLLLVSDPIYQESDPRLAGRPPTTRQFARAGPRFRGGGTPDSLPRLPGTAREADNIRALFPASAVDDLRGADATRVEFLGRDLGKYRYMHVATHGVMDADIPAMSALVLGAFGAAGRVADQEIRAGDFLGQTLDADLVVLSACETSLGPSYPDEGPMGLRYAVLARGARAVISSLWMTPDELSADLMTDMYAGMLGRNEHVEFALVDAMRKMLARRPALDPALWAAYSAYVVNE